MNTFFKKSSGIAKLGVGALLICVIVTVFKASPILNVCSGLRPWGELIFNICISIFAAFAFYILQVYIPEERELKNAEKALKSNFLELARMIELEALGIEEFVDIIDGKVNIKWNDPHGTQKIFFGVTSGNEESCGMARCYTEKELLDLDNEYRKRIQNIKQSVFARYLDYELVELLSELENAPIVGSIRGLLFCEKYEINHGEIKGIIEKSRKISSKTQKRFNTAYSFSRKELDVRERVISSNANKPQMITDIDGLNKEIMVEAAWEQAINNPDIMKGVQSDKELLYKLIRKAILDAKKE